MSRGIFKDGEIKKGENPFSDSFLQAQQAAMNEYAKQQAIAFHDWNNIPVGSYETTDELYELFLKTKQL